MIAQPVSPKIRNRLIRERCMEALKAAGPVGVVVTGLHNAICAGDDELSVVTTRLMVANTMRDIVKAGLAEARPEAMLKGGWVPWPPTRYWLVGSAPAQSAAALGHE